MKREIIYGPPGTGKTATLLKIVEDCLKKKIPPKEIAFIAFTRKAANEAKARAKEKFGFSDHFLMYFRTLHSICYRELGLTKGLVLGKEQYKEIGKILGWKFTGYINPEGPEATTSKADHCLYLSQLARTKVQELNKTWNEYSEDTPFKELKYFNNTYEKYKEKNGFYDFTDMLSLYRKMNPLDIQVGIVDEAQDLSYLQWLVINHLFQKAKTIYVAGDDDQAIYKWSGASHEYLLHLKGKKRILTKSYRLPESIFKVSQDLIKNVKERQSKKFLPKNTKGKVIFHNYPDYLEVKPNETYYFLARNRFLLHQFEDLLIMKGLTFTNKEQFSVRKKHGRAIYTWTDMTRNKEVNNQEDALQFISDWQVKDIKKLLKKDWYEALNLIPVNQREYYRSILRAGGHLLNPSPLHLNTIHGVKGGQADNVILLLDMSFKTFKAYQKDLDNEHRVFYVGATRAKKSLEIIMPQTNLYYKMF